MQSSKSLLRLVVVFSLKSFSALAIDNNQADRERVVNARNDRFYKSNTIRQYVNFGGEYESDEDSKQYVLSFGHFYRSSKLINEIDFLHQVDYSDKNVKVNGKNELQSVKTSELYDFQISTKAIIKDTQNYFIFYNRTKYDDLSKYYYDSVSSIGGGRMFFNDRLEIDFGIGYSNVKNFGEKITYVPSFRTEFDITPKLHFIQRGFMYFSGNADDYQLRTRIQYLISPRLYLQITHDYDQRIYDVRKTHHQYNETHRRIVFGFRYDLGQSSSIAFF